MTSITIPAGMWRPTGEWDGPPLDQDLTMQPTDVVAGVEEGWCTVTGYRACGPGEISRPIVTIRAYAAALPPDLIQPESGAR